MFNMILVHALYILFEKDDLNNDWKVNISNDMRWNLH